MYQIFLPGWCYKAFAQTLGNFAVVVTGILLYVCQIIVSEELWVSDSRKISVWPLPCID